jgi:hypothetical protein
MVFEGYGPSGVAVMVEALTDNKNRTAGDLRHFFDKCGGETWRRAGASRFSVRNQGPDRDENEERSISEEQNLRTPPRRGYGREVRRRRNRGLYRALFPSVRLRRAWGAGLRFLVRPGRAIPSTYTVFEDPEQRQKMYKLIDMLEENDDVQEVYHNWDIPDENRSIEKDRRIFRRAFWFFMREGFSLSLLSVF